MDSAGGFGPPGRGIEALRALISILLVIIKLQNKKLYLIGVILIISGFVYIISYAHVYKLSHTTNLDLQKTITLTNNHIENNIGFYKTIMNNNHDNIVMIQIIDPNGNISDYKKIKTEMSVNYFDLRYDGTYTIKINALDKTKIDVGKINLDVIYHGIFAIVCGIVFILIPFSYVLKVYKIAQPEEKI